MRIQTLRVIFYLYGMKINNNWIHIPKNDNIIGNDITINNVQKYDNFILFSTFNGLIIYDIEYASWHHSYNFLNVSNRVVWDVNFYK